MPASAQIQKKESDFRELPVIFGFFIWWIKVVPSKIIYIAKKLTLKAFAFFSIDLLLKTLILPWKRDEVDTTNMALDDRLKVWMMNLVSRLVGAVIRGAVICFGLLTIIGIFLGEIIALVGFILMPVIIIALIVMSIAPIKF
ncbi:MAG: hypothetical protein NTZ65_04160 [Candidatus Berkelbacteria bacterium]|nr:hypothetical protein [Candidatus Berkelbacteria bacterium]